MSIVDKITRMTDQELTQENANNFSDTIKAIKNYNEYQLIYLYLIDKDEKSSKKTPQFAQNFKAQINPIISRHNEMVALIEKNNVLNAQGSTNSIGGAQVLWDLALTHATANTAVSSEVTTALQAMSLLLCQELRNLQALTEESSGELSRARARTDSGEKEKEKVGNVMPDLTADVLQNSSPVKMNLKSWNNFTVAIEHVKDHESAKITLKGLSISA